MKTEDDDGPGVQGSIESLVVSPQLARDGTVVSVSFEVRPPADAVPLVQVAGLTASVIDQDAGSYRFESVARADVQDEGEQSVRVEAVVEGFTLVETASLNLDFTAPAVARANATPTVAGPGEEVTIAIVLGSDAVSFALEIENGVGEAPVCALESDGLQVSCTYIVAEGDADGAQRLLWEGKDKAGNTASDALEGILSFFTATPAGVNAEVTPAAGSVLGLGESVALNLTAPFELSIDGTCPTGASFGEQPFAFDSLRQTGTMEWTYTYTLVAAGDGGEREIAVQAWDSACNPVVTSPVGSLFVDTEPPTFAGVTATFLPPADGGLSCGRTLEISADPRDVDALMPGSLSVKLARGRGEPRNIELRAAPGIDWGGHVDLDWECEEMTVTLEISDAIGNRSAPFTVPVEPQDDVCTPWLHRGVTDFTDIRKVAATPGPDGQVYTSVPFDDDPTDIGCGEVDAIGSNLTILLSAHSKDSGQCLWSKAIGDGGHETTSDMIALPNGDVVVAVNTRSGLLTMGCDSPRRSYPRDALTISTRTSNIVVARLRGSDGRCEWAAHFAGPGHEQGARLAQLDSGEVIVVGMTNSSVFSTPCDPEMSLPNEGSGFALFASSLNASTGHCQWLTTSERNLGEMRINAVNAGAELLIAGVMPGPRSEVPPVGGFGANCPAVAHPPVDSSGDNHGFVMRLDAADGECQWRQMLFADAAEVEIDALTSPEGGSFYVLGDFETRSSGGAGLDGVGRGNCRETLEGYAPGSFVRDNVFVREFDIESGTCLSQRLLPQGLNPFGTIAVPRPGHELLWVSRTAAGDAFGGCGPEEVVAENNELAVVQYAVDSGECRLFRRLRHMPNLTVHDLVHDGVDSFYIGGYYVREEPHSLACFDLPPAGQRPIGLLTRWNQY